MSHNINETALALAVMAAFVVATPAALAATVDNGSTSNPLPMKVANVAFNGTNDPGTALNALNINISTTDLIIGRTTGFSVRIQLPDNVTFASIPDPTIGAALPCSGTTSCWTATLAAGGGTSDSYAVYSVQPGSESQGVTAGKALSFAGGSMGGTYPNVTFSGLAIAGAGVSNLVNVGSSVAATVSFADPNTAQQILTPVSQTLVVSADPLTYTMAASSNLQKKIDVGSAVVASKTGYSSDGTLNKSPSERFFDAGTPTVGVATGVEDINNVPFGWGGADTVDLTVTGTFNAFTQSGASVSLVTYGTCATPSISITGSVTASQVTFSDVSLSNVDGQSEGHNGILCFTVPSGNTEAIDATTISTSATVTRSSSGTSTSGSGDGLAMQYNGPVAKVFTFNPGNNTSMQSLLRITNTGGTGGTVTITGKDDSGGASGSVSFTLAAGTSIQLTAQDLENGNAAKGLTGSLGAGTGKWRLTVTGQIAGMEVTNLNRSQSTDMLNNLGTPVSGNSGAQTTPGPT